MLSCKKKEASTTSSNGSPSPVPITCMDTTVNVDFVIQAIGSPYTGINLNSYGYDSNSQYTPGSNFNDPISSNLNYYSAGDTSHINKCTATIVISKTMLFSKTYFAHFSIQLQRSTGFQNVQFDYNPTLRKFTSYIYPFNANATGQGTVHSTLATNTGYSLNCKTGKWVIYCKY